MTTENKTHALTKAEASTVKPTPSVAAATDTSPSVPAGVDQLSEAIVPENYHDPKPPRPQDMPAQGIPGLSRPCLSQEEIQSPVQLRQEPTSTYDEQTSDIDMGGDAIDKRLAETSPTNLEPTDPRARSVYPLVDNPDHKPPNPTSTSK